jgi:hypothetical protein
MWNLDLDTKIPNPHDSTEEPQTSETIKVIFDLPSSHETFLWYHASAGFPPKETFIRAVCNGSYATWPKLMVPLVNLYFPDSDKTVKGHLKDQRQGI